MTVAIVGGSGFLGSHVVARLHEYEESTRLLVRTSSTDETRQDPGRVVGDVGDEAALARLFDDTDTVVHLAGYGRPGSDASDFARILDVNVSGSLNVLRCAVQAGVRRVILASSSSVYGATGRDRLAETDPVFPLSVYGSAKLTVERLAKAFSAQYGIETTCLRIFNLFGYGQHIRSQRHLLIPKLMSGLLTHTPLRVRGDGCQTRDFVDVHDAASVIAQLATGPSRADGKILNLGTGKPTKVIEVIESLSVRLGVEPIVEHSRRAPGEIQHAIADTQRLHRLLPDFQPKPIRHFIENLSASEIGAYASTIERPKR